MVATTTSEMTCPALSPGMQFGRYELTEPLASGGTGHVWSARDTGNGDSVALKFVTDGRKLPDVWSERLRRDLTRRLLREARFLARVDHPAVVRVLDVGRPPATPAFFAMELLMGEDLGTARGRGAPSPTFWVFAVLPIVAALAKAHSCGVLHLDVKPENIFLHRTVEGLRPKLLDFGYAEPRWSRACRRPRELLRGTASYMSPEQARGEILDARTDVWSICMTLYTMITGANPFDDDSQTKSLSRIAAEEGAQWLDDPVDSELCGIVERGLIADRDWRWKNMRELHERLHQWWDSKVGVPWKDYSGCAAAELDAAKLAD